MMSIEGRHAVRARGHLPGWLLGSVVAVAALSFASMAVRVVADGPDEAVAGPTGTEGNDGTFEGLWTFRGNLSRAYVGAGPVPSAPVIRWRHPAEGGPMCSFSAEGRDPSATKEWCGTGWTGQPNVVPFRGAMQVRVGAYDGAYHFVDAGSGAATLMPLQTGDLAKGSATTDPDGRFPLYYGGSRDNVLRVIALDREEPTVLWELDAVTSVPEALWNDDWDGAPLVVGDVLLEGGENGWLYVIRLGRGFDERGQVTVSPQVLATIRSYDDELLAAVGDQDNSIEGSVAFRDGVVYLANSAGLVQGWDIVPLLEGEGEAEQVFRFWTGDDTDASVVIDEEGMLYVASEFQRFLDRSREVGQLMKLDPSRPEDPLVWSVDATEIGFDGAGGSWSTAALDGDRVYFTTASGRVVAVDRADGDVIWQLQVGAPAIASPVVVDGVLLQGDCTGRLSAWDVDEAVDAPPPLRWSIDLGDCIESTPAVWRGWVYLGTREGYLYGIADRDTAAP